MSKRNQLHPLLVTTGRWLWRHRLAAAIVLAVLVPSLLWVRYRLSAGYVANLTVSALERGDVEGLLALASRTERETLNLTPETVRAYLRKTWLADGKRRTIRLHSEEPYLQDVIKFEGTCRTEGSGGKPRRFRFTVYQNKHGQWRTALSLVLYVLVNACELVPKEGDDPNMTWARIAHSVGIPAAIFPDGGNEFRWSGTGVSDPKPFNLMAAP